MAGFPEVAQSKLDAGAWQQRVREETTVFKLPGVSVLGYTVLYEDARLQSDLERAGYGDLFGSDSADDGQLVDDDSEYWRFFFATGLSFQPPLTPGIGPASIKPTVRLEARRTFRRDLQSRGFEDVDSGRGQHVRTDSGERASLIKYTASYRLVNAPADTLDIEAWLAVWSTGGEFRIAGGAYPVSGLGELLATLDEDGRQGTDPSDYRDELLALIRAVE